MSIVSKHALHIVEWRRHIPYSK